MACIISPVCRVSALAAAGVILGYLYDEDCYTWRETFEDAFTWGVFGLPIRAGLNWRRGDSVESGIDYARRLGRAGEEAAGITGPKVGVTIPGTNRTRFPDSVTREVLTEVKNVGHQNFTRQLRDYLTFDEQSGRRMELWVRPTTTFSRSLQAAIDAGRIIVRYLP